MMVEVVEATLANGAVMASWDAMESRNHRKTMKNRKTILELFFSFFGGGVWAMW